ncbi:MAG: hypothetical protein EZS28_008808 [Streblomastix strix]|uniref:Uncharacterized protein n=1 Tax=Streblomastix strix TaxID=222440 RepID=A0A5J4WN60_9EUKA|nr:MAG: hypothetical protein EZS28_008808 [Streblomastix strix]
MFNTIYIRNQIVEQLHAEVMQTTKPALIKMRVAIVLGWLHENSILPSKMQNQVTEQIIKALNCVDYTIQADACHSLCCLAQQQGNHANFVKEETIINISEIIIAGNEIILPHALCLVQNLLDKGSKLSVELLKSIIKVDYIRLHLVSKKNDYILRIILAQLTNTEFMQNLFKLIKDSEKNGSKKLLDAKEYDDQIKILTMKMQKVINEQKECLDGEILRICDTFAALSKVTSSAATSTHTKISFVALLLRALNRSKTVIIHPIHVGVIEYVNTFCNYRQTQDLIKEGLFTVIANSLKQNDINLIQSTLSILKNILKESSKQEKKGKKITHFSVLEKEGIITMLIDLIISDDQELTEDMKDLAVVSLGFIYKALPLQGERQKVVVTQLKLIIANKPKTMIMEEAIVALSLISENECL